MKLDKRIENERLIYTPFTTNKPKLHEKGYFTDDITSFNNLKNCRYGELINRDDNQYSYCCEFNGGDTIAWFAFYIPESSLKPKEKSYRPFKDTKEFFIKTNFEEGDVIRIRSKPHNTEYHTMLVGWTDNELMLGSLRIAFLTELFEKFELWDGEDKFIPFGVEQ